VHVAVGVLGWSDSPWRERAGAAAFAVVRLRHASQRDLPCSLSGRDRVGGGVGATATTVLLSAASRQGGGQGQKKGSGSQSGGGFGKVVETRPGSDPQKEPGKRRSTVSRTIGGERGDAGLSQPDEVRAVNSPAQLDKWGLPPPTLDDIFPPLPDGTELVPVESGTHHTLEQIQNALREVVPLALLDRHFDELGVERDSAVAAGRSGHGNPRRKKMKLRLLHQSPPVLAIDNFFTPEECAAARRVAEAHPDEKSGPPPVQISSKTFEGAISRRTSTSWFCRYRQHPVLLAKAVHLLGLELYHTEEPQVVRYQTGQEFSFHYDQVPAHQRTNGGQRLATLLYVCFIVFAWHLVGFLL
jgi:hypothetical protein